MALLRDEMTLPCGQRKPRRDESSLDAALCRRLSRRHRSPHHGAARGLSPADDALLAQGRTARRRPATLQDRQAAAEDLVRVSRDLAGFLLRGVETQADRRRAGEDDARFRKARDRRPEGRHRLGAGADEAGERRAVPARPVPEQLPGHRSSRAAAGVDHSHPHHTESFQGGGEFCRTLEAAAGRRAQQPAIPVSPELAAYVAKRTT